MSVRLIRITGRLGVTLGLALVILGSPTAVGAAAVPRLSGYWSVTLTVTAQKHSYNTVGQKIVRSWKFTPKCASGGCDTKLARTRGDNTVSHYTLHSVLKNGAWRYTTNTTQLTNCYDGSGSLLKRNAYSSAEKIVLKVGHVSGGHVTRFTGTYALTLTATNAAKARGCKNGFVKGTFRS